MTYYQQGDAESWFHNRRNMILLPRFLRRNRKILPTIRKEKNPTATLLIYDMDNYLLVMIDLLPPRTRRKTGLSSKSVIQNGHPRVSNIPTN